MAALGPRAGIRGPSGTPTLTPGGPSSAPGAGSSATVGTSGTIFDGASVGAVVAEGAVVLCGADGVAEGGATGITHRRLTKGDAGVGIVTSAASGTIKYAAAPMACTATDAGNNIRRRRERPAASSVRRTSRRSSEGIGSSSRRPLFRLRHRRVRPVPRESDRVPEPHDSPPLMMAEPMNMAVSIAVTIMFTMKPITTTITALPMFV